ncbi:MAG: IS21-like element helper ATPase IstB [Myxococcota bacterium]
MLSHPTLDKLHELKLTGMARALEEQLQTRGPYAEMSFEERLGLLVDREELDRTDRRLKHRLRRAKLRQAASVEDLDFRHPRGLDRRLLASLIGCGWIAEHRNLLVTGPTGTGKTYIACALAHKACREGYTALYVRCSTLLRELELARVDGSYGKRLNRLAKIDVLVLDDWGLVPIAEAQRRDLYEILEDRTGLRSTIVTSQYPVDTWHELLGEPTLADAILDRLVHGAHRIALSGDSMRKEAS